jgi:hypothetical protein
METTGHDSLRLGSMLTLFSYEYNVSLYISLLVTVCSIPHELLFI